MEEYPFRGWLSIKIVRSGYLTPCGTASCASTARSSIAAIQSIHLSLLRGPDVITVVGSALRLISTHGPSEDMTFRTMTSLMRSLTSSSVEGLVVIAFYCFLRVDVCPFDCGLQTNGANPHPSAQQVAALREPWALLGQGLHSPSLNPTIAQQQPFARHL